MSRVLGATLPKKLLHAIDGSRIDKLRQVAVPIITIDSAGRPHPAMLSFSELIAKDRRNILIVTFASSSTSRNLQSGRALCIIFIIDRTFYYVKGKAMLLRRSIKKLSNANVFNVSISQVLVDSSPYAEVTSPIKFRNLEGGEAHDLVFNALQSMQKKECGVTRIKD